MNALPNYLPNCNNASVGLLNQVPVNPFQMTNTLTPSVFGDGFNSGFNSGNNVNAQTKKEIEQLYKQGLITEEEYRNKLRALAGFTVEASSSDAVDKDGQIISLYGEELEAARKSNTGDYAVTKDHQKLANNMIEAAKEALKGGASLSTISQLEEIFSMANKNPILADAFLTEANRTTFTMEKGKQTNILGCYQQIVTSVKGKDNAAKMTTKIHKNFSENVSKRNQTQWSKFNSFYNEDINKIITSDGTEVSNWFSDNSGAIIGGTTATVGAMALLRSCGIEGGGFFSSLKFLGKWGLPLAAVGGGIAYLIHSINQNKE